MGVAEQLDFDVARLDQRLFQNQLITAERVLRLGARGAHVFQQMFALMHQAHATPAATGAGLDHQRVADALGFPLQRGVVLGAALVTGDAGHTGVEHGQFGQALAAHQLDGLDAGADKGEVGLPAGAGKVGVFRKEAVAGVDGVGTCASGCVEDGRDVEVRLLHRRRADIHRFVRHLHMQGLAVGLAVHRHGAVAQGLGSALDAAGDFAAVGDEDFVECGHWVIPRVIRVSVPASSGASPLPHLKRVPLWEKRCDDSTCPR